MCYGYNAITRSITIRKRIIENNNLIPKFDYVIKEAPTHLSYRNQHWNLPLLTICQRFRCIKLITSGCVSVPFGNVIVRFEQDFRLLQNKIFDYSKVFRFESNRIVPKYYFSTKTFHLSNKLFWNHKSKRIVMFFK